MDRSQTEAGLTGRHREQLKQAGVVIPYTGGFKKHYCGRKWCGKGKIGGRQTSGLSRQFRWQTLGWNIGCEDEGAREGLV